MYSNKQDLIAEIKKTSKPFIDEFDLIDEEEKNKLIDGVDRTPAQMIAYQLGWMNLLLSWDKAELDGKKVITPTAEYKWNQLGGLYESFYEKYNYCSLIQLKELFSTSVEQVITWVDSFSDEELFTQDIRKWASSTPSKWPVWKWVHINTVAPFKSFRTKIRKWKKINTAIKE